MINQLDMTNKDIVKQMLNIQIPAYKVEAEIINFDGIPQLQDTVDSLMKLDETFLGYWLDDVLVGFISYTSESNGCDICRLVVDPKHFRKGVAKSLLEYLLKQLNNKNIVSVSTGKANVPAKYLYEKYGFQEEKDVEVAPNVYITQFSKQIR